MSRPKGRRLPTELLIAIADHLCSARDIVAFGLTCKDLYTFQVKQQRRSLKIVFDGSQTTGTLLDASKHRLLSQRATMLKLPGADDSFEQYQIRLGSGRTPICPWHRTRVFAQRMVPANQLFSQDDCRLARSVRELTLSGYFPYSNASGHSLTSHPFMRGTGFKAIRPETFRVDLGWNDWDIGILHGMSVTKLKVLKLPLRLPSDCARLGQALTVMPRLVSLAITDIPDREEFETELEHIGKGIMSCASTLRELDIEMTNFNRPASWDHDERFLEPEERGFFFRKLFPCPTNEELLALCERHDRHGTDPMVEAPFSLTKLRLKHVSLPWYSFVMIFNAVTIKHLHLPYSMIDDAVWELLENYAQLDSLTDISYDMLSTKFLSFLEQQSSLKELSFARPQDQYDEEDVISYGASRHQVICLAKEAPRLGPDIGAEYPSLNDTLSSFKDLTMLRHLVLPADMYTITRGCLSCVAASLTGLEHLEFGFDYNDLELQRVFASCFLRGTPTLKKITFFSLKQPRPLLDFDAAHFHAFLASLGEKVPPSLKLVRYMPLDQVRGHPYANVDVHYHRDMPVDGAWWIRLPLNERKETFAEGLTPRIVPVGKWDWEIEAEQNAHLAGLERGVSGSQGCIE